MRLIGGFLLRLVTIAMVACVLVAVASRQTPARAMVALVPAYFYPSGSGTVAWGLLSSTAGSVLVQAVLNPANGPGVKQDPNYVSVVNRLRAARGKVLGYVHTSYTARDLEKVKEDILKYQKFYQVDGFFVDEMSSDPRQVPYYAELYTFIKGLDREFKVVGNPGTTPDEAYLIRRTSDTLVIFEGTGESHAYYTPPRWIGKYGPSRFGHIVYDVPTADEMRKVLDRSMRNNIGSVFITDGRGANPYDRLPPYWNQARTALRAIPDR